MNKQEVIEKINNAVAHETFMTERVWLKYDEAIDIINQLDEPEKPVVPQYVADWYEKNEYSLERNIYTLCIRSYQRELPKEEFSKWFDDVRNKAIETLVKMKLYGYEVEKEKLYTVELPNPNTNGHAILCKNMDGYVVVSVSMSGRWKGSSNAKLTESEIREDFEWAWQFAEEVKE